MTIAIPGYQILRELGQGAMGIVYLAVQESLQRKVALKVLHVWLTNDESFRERFLKEGRIVAQLKHNNIVTVHDIGQHESHFYMDLEYAGGGSLSDRIRDGIGEKEAVNLTIDIANALAYAHKHDFIHRDIKPENILFRDDDTALLSDFGIAKCLTANTQLTVVGTSIGTPDYMSPEQAMGNSVTAQSDLYSLGVTFHEMLTGKRPYKADSAYAVVSMHINSPIPALPAQYSRYQPIMDSCMAKLPEDRFTSAEALVQALRRTESGAAGSDETVVLQSDRVNGTGRNHSNLGHLSQSSKPPQAGRKEGQTSKRPVIWAVGGILVLAVGSIGFWWWHASTTANTEIPGPVAAIALNYPETLIERHFAALEMVGLAYRELESASTIEDDRAGIERWDKLVPKLVTLISQARAKGDQALALSLSKRALAIVPETDSLTKWREAIVGATKKTRLTKDQRDTVNGLLATANTHLDAGRFTLPEGSNALALYQQVLLIDQDNPEARKKLYAMADIFVTLARENIAQAAYDKAAMDIEVGLMIAPQHAGLRSLSQKFVKP